MRILLIGGNGQLGFELHRQLSVFGEVTITTRTSKCPAGYPCIYLDLSDGEAIRDVLESLRPHLVVNAGAYTQVDRAESEHEAVDSANKIAVQTIAKKCREIGSLLVHFSSDYVYSGENRVPWVETDPTQPFSYYGLSKLGGDQAIVDSGCPYWIIRTQWLYSARGANFMRTMLRVAHERALEVLRLHTDDRLDLVALGHVLVAHHRCDSRDHDRSRDQIALAEGGVDKAAREDFGGYLHSRWLTFRIA